MDYKLVLLLLLIVSNTSLGSSEVFSEFVSVPGSILTGQNFTVVATISTDKKAEFEVYSYVYNASKCYSFYGWKGNSRKYFFEAGQNKTVELTDVLKHETPSGNYTLKLRVRGEKDYDLTRQITVKQTKPDLGRKVDFPKADHQSRKGIMICSALALFFLVGYNFFFKK